MSLQIRFARALAAVLLSLLSVAPLVAQRCPEVFFHAEWLSQDGRKLPAANRPEVDLRWGETLSLRPGEEVRLDTRVVNSNQSSRPYQPSVVYGFADSRGGGRVLEFASDPKQPDVQRSGAIDLRAESRGHLKLTFRMLDLDASVNRSLQAAIGDARCTEGTIQVEVRDAVSSAPPAADSGSSRAAEAADFLYQGILLRTRSADEGAEFVQQLASGRYQDFLDVAHDIAESTESRERVTPRLQAEIGGGDAVAARTNRTLEALIGPLSPQDGLSRVVYDAFRGGRPWVAIQSILRDERFIERHGDLWGGGLGDRRYQPGRQRG